MDLNDVDRENGLNRIVCKISLFVLISSLDNVSELWLERSASDQESINIWKVDEVGGVTSVDGSSVKDSCGGGDLWGDVFVQPGSDVFVGLLSLLWGSDLTGTDGPDWLVSNDDIAPMSNSELISNSLKLSSVNNVGLSGLSLLELLSNANHDVHSVINGDLGLDGNILIGLTKERSSFGVTGEGPLDTNIGELISGDISSESTSSILRHILGRDLDILLNHGLNSGEMDISWGDNDLNVVLIELNLVKGLGDKLGGEVNISI